MCSPKRGSRHAQSALKSIRVCYQRCLSPRRSIDEQYNLPTQSQTPSTWYFHSLTSISDPETSAGSKLSYRPPFQNGRSTSSAAFPILSSQTSSGRYFRGSNTFSTRTLPQGKVELSHFSTKRSIDEQHYVPAHFQDSNAETWRCNPLICTFQPGRRS